MSKPCIRIPNFDELKLFLSTPQNIVITAHLRPDADALGSALGLYHFLQKFGHVLTVIMPTTYPDFLKWMNGNENVLVYEENQEKSQKAVDNADMIFCLDFSSLSRLGAFESLIKNSIAPKVLIDHHEGKDDFAKYELWDIDAAATAELIYEFIGYFEIENSISVAGGECIYAGILTDTGGFKHPSTTSNVHRIVADLMDLGVDTAMVNRCIYDTFSENKLRFWGHAFNERLTLIPEHNTAFFKITARDLERFDYQSGDTEGLVNYALALKGIKLAVLFIEREKIRISFRSVGDISVSNLAKEHFNGGGHKNASGGQSNDSIEATVSKFVEVLPAFMQGLESSIHKKV